MNKKVKKMFGRRVLLKLETTFQDLGNGMKMHKEVQSRRELVVGTVQAIPDEYVDVLAVGDTVIFPFYSANEAGRLGKDFVTVDINDLEWSEEDGS